MGMFDENGNFSSKHLVKYAHDLLVVAMLREGVNVPLAKLDAVEDLGEIMVALNDAEEAMLEQTK